MESETNVIENIVLLWLKSLCLPMEFKACNKNIPSMLGLTKLF